MGGCYCGCDGVNMYLMCTFVSTIYSSTKVNKHLRLLEIAHKTQENQQIKTKSAIYWFTIRIQNYDFMATAGFVNNEFCGWDSSYSNDSL